MFALGKICAEPLKSNEKLRKTPCHRFSDLSEFAHAEVDAMARRALDGL